MDVMKIMSIFCILHRFSRNTSHKGVIEIETTPIYVSVANMSYSHVPVGAPCEFKLEMDERQAKVFKYLFKQIDSIEFHNMVRAHLPYIPYHLDSSNHEIDYRLQKVYALIHEFGDEETKRFVEQLPYFN